MALPGGRAGQTPLLPRPAWPWAPSPETVDAVPPPPLALGTTPSSIHRRMATVISDGCQASPVQFRGAEWSGPGWKAWRVAQGTGAEAQACSGWEGEPGTSSIRCLQGHCRWSRLRLWYLICLHGKAPHPRGVGRARGLGTPPHLSQRVCTCTPPPSRALPRLPPSPPAPGARGLSVALLAPRAGFSPWRGGKPWAWGSPSLGPSVPGLLLVLHAPTRVGGEGVPAGRHGVGQRSTRRARDLLCTEPH